MVKKKPISKSQTRIIINLTLLLLVAVTGCAAMVFGHAQSLWLSVEPETGVSGTSVQQITDSNASGGSAIKFSATAPSAKPPAGGFFSLKPVGSFSTLPNDSQASAVVHHSSWEPRSENTTANHTVPPSSFTSAGYSGMQNHAAVFGRVTGNFTGTTDEIIQWAAAKWGLPDEVIRADAVTESYWYQNNKDAGGKPIQGQGYGDFGSCGGSPAPSGYGSAGPASFGLMQDKWCSFKDASAPGYDGWPWSEQSTAYNLDLYGAVIRGCYEGYDTWLGNGYAAGDLYGCLGRWFSGTWYGSGAQNYIDTVKTHYANKEWLSW